MLFSSILNGINTSLQYHYSLFTRSITIVTIMPPNMNITYCWQWFLDSNSVYYVPSSKHTLRQMKNTYRKGRKLVTLPPKVIETCLVELSAGERRCYDEMERQSQGSIRSSIAAGNLPPNHHTVLSFMLRLRQICNDAALCPSKLTYAPRVNNFKGN